MADPSFSLLQQIAPNLAQAVMPLHPLVASVMTANAQMASDAQGKDAAADQATKLAKSSVTQTTKADGTMDLHIKGVPSDGDPQKVVQDATAKPLEDVVDAINTHGIAGQQAPTTTMPSAAPPAPAQASGPPGAAGSSTPPNAATHNPTAAGPSGAPGNVYTGGDDPTGIFETLKSRGIVLPRPNNPSDLALPTTYTGRKMLAHQLNAAEGTNISGWQIGHNGPHGVPIDYALQQLANIRAEQGDAAYQKHVAPQIAAQYQRAQTEAMTAFRQEGTRHMIDTEHEKAVHDFINAGLPQHGTAENAVAQFHARNPNATPQDDQLIAGSFNSQALKEGKQEGQTVAKQIAGMKVEDLGGYTPDTVDKFVQTQSDAAQRPFTPAETANVKAKALGLFADKAKSDENERLKQMTAQRQADAASRTAAAAERAAAAAGGQSTLSEPVARRLVRAENNGAMIDPKLKGQTDLFRANLPDSDPDAAFPVALSGGTEQLLSKVDAIKGQSAMLRQKVADAMQSIPKSQWNTPLQNLPAGVKYKLGIASEDDLGKLKSAFSINNIAGTMALIPGMRNGRVIEMVKQHTPNFDVDSLQLMKDKLDNMNDFYNSSEASLKRYGTKSGVPSGGAPGDQNAPKATHKYVPGKGIVPINQ
jgi:hypothetical protein